jgi:hypothetical protein
MPGEMRLAFLVCLAGVALLFVTLWRLELSSKNASEQLRRLRRRLEETPFQATGAATAKPPAVPARPSGVD